MKKYLMTGITALALCVGFTSCSHDVTSQEDIQTFEAEKIVKDYEAAFIKTFGQPAANQDWGFSTTADSRTRRAVDPNGNMWNDAPGIGENEEDDVVAYVHALTTYSKDDAINLTDYYVTHIHKGLDEEYNEYTAYNGGDAFFGSNLMDQLIIADNAPSTIDADQGTLANSANWYHVYDFNSSQNTDWSGNMRVVESGTLNFAYWNSLDEKWHDRWIAVKGSDINSDLYGDYIYICFDYEGIPKSASDNYTEIAWKVPGNNPGEWFDMKGTIPGTWNLETAYEANKKITANVTNVANDNSEFSIYQEGTTGWTVTQVSKGDKFVAGNNDYTDWIIRLKAINTTSTRPVLRVFAEDLSAKASENAGEGASDWDFNDVVFDAEYVDATHAKITLWAAGGTLPLQINSINGTKYEGGCEVHEKLLGTPSYKTMINTHAKPYATGEYGWRDNVAKQVFNITIPQDLIEEKGGDFDSEKYAENFPLAVRDLIRIEVYKGEQWYELTAAKGKPACKIATSAEKVKWLKEKVDIRAGYPTFKQYVGYPSVNWWSPAVEDYLYNVDGNSVQCKVCE